MEQKGDSENYATYLHELIIEMRQLNRLKFIQKNNFGLENTATLLTAEITRVWNMIYDVSDDEMGDSLETVRLQRKIPIPIYPNGYDEQGRRRNLVGRILGPNGHSVRRLEAETGCEILIRGEGSIKDPNKHLRLKGTKGFEHLDEPLHVVVIAVDNSLCHAEEKLEVACEIIKKLLTSDNDAYKKKQLLQLAMIKGTYRERRNQP